MERVFVDLIVGRRGSLCAHVYTRCVRHDYDVLDCHLCGGMYTTGGGHDVFYTAKWTDRTRKNVHACGRCVYTNHHEMDNWIEE